MSSSSEPTLDIRSLGKITENIALVENQATNAVMQKNWPPFAKFHAVLGQKIKKLLNMNWL